MKSYSQYRVPGECLTYLLMKKIGVHIGQNLFCAYYDDDFLSKFRKIQAYIQAQNEVLYFQGRIGKVVCVYYLDLFRLNTIQYYQSSIENNYPWRKCCSYLLIFNSIWWLLYLSIQLSYFQGRIRNLVCVYYSNCVLSNTINYSLSWRKIIDYFFNFLRFHSNFAKKKF